MQRTTRCLQFSETCTDHAKATYTVIKKNQIIKTKLQYNANDKLSDRNNSTIQCEKRQLALLVENHNILLDQFVFRTNDMIRMTISQRICLIDKLYIHFLLICCLLCCNVSLGTSSEVVHEQRRELYARMLQYRKKTTAKTKTTRQSQTPTSSPIQFEHVYEAGNLYHTVLGLTLSKGLTASLIATVGNRVRYESGYVSKDRFMELPDAAATFPTKSGGWIYTINSEYRVPKPLHRTGEADDLGGVSAIQFNKYGEIIDYKILLNGTYANCGGGRTPWGTWISCEEYTAGQIWQVDPTGKRKSQITTLGSISPGLFEAFAYDTRNKKYPRFFVTKDDKNGEIRRFTPNDPDWDDPWTMLHNNGTLEYLVLIPKDNITAAGAGKYYWTKNINKGQESAASLFPNSEGIDVVDNLLYFVTKKFRRLYRLDLDRSTYMYQSTELGLFNGAPDQIVHVKPTTEQKTTINNDGTSTTSSGEVIDEVQPMAYFTEDGADVHGIHAVDNNGTLYTILESYEYDSETTGLAFSPNFQYMYVAYQKTGLVFSIHRLDGQPFYGTSINVKHH